MAREYSEEFRKDAVKQDIEIERNILTTNFNNCSYNEYK